MKLIIKTLAQGARGGNAAPGMALHSPQPLAPSAPLVVVPPHRRVPPSPSSDFVVSPPCHLPLLLTPLSLSISVGGDVAVSTRSALRANASSGGGRVLGRRHRRLSPHIHPTSWGSQRWWCRPVPLGRRRHSTHHPPHEQLLVRLEAGGVLSVIVVGPWSWSGLVVLYSHTFHRTNSGSWQWLGVLSSSVPFHPRSTPRAVAREAGGGWWVVMAYWRHPSLA
jgi:hypothetical protein